MSNVQSLPNWMVPRASRLVGAILEATLDVYGYAGLLARLRNPGFIGRLHALVGAQHTQEAATVASLIKRSLKHDAVRLNLTVDDTRVMLSDGRFAPLPLSGPPLNASSDPTTHAHPLRSPTRAFVLAGHTVDDARLSSAFDLSFLPLPSPFDDVARRPRTGPRVVTSLALVAEVIFTGMAPVDSLANKRASRAFGDDAATGIYIEILDTALRQLEKMLHRGDPTSSRVSPLASLAQILDDGAKAGRGPHVQALSKRDDQAARSFAFVPLAASKGPRVFRRCPRRVTRRLHHFQPMQNDRGVDQGDLFAW